MITFKGIEKLDLYLEAEVASGQQSDFEQRYKSATEQTISPGRPPCYQNQGNKWGRNCAAILMMKHLQNI